MTPLESIHAWISARPWWLRWPLAALFAVAVFVGWCLAQGINGRRR